MMELELKTVAEAEESNFTCRSCEKVELGFGRIGREWADTVQESKWEIRVEREKRVQLEAQVGDMNKRAEADVVEMTREWESKRSMADMGKIIDTLLPSPRAANRMKAKMPRLIECELTEFRPIMWGQPQA
ncbi:hypothetical protein ISCGN_030145 [Ixodes scapularis]